jgi:hypothetical protein
MCIIYKSNVKEEIRRGMSRGIKEELSGQGMDRELRPIEEMDL